ncbi:MAG: hypothetical protein KC478_17210, partial [Bacteriovoracaceae bacterium]|nr:hypothetical protein [Bacteriovoracaceae bacterium]
KLQEEANQKRFEFIETATNISLRKADPELKETNLTKDIKDIIDPMLDGIKKISERPRAIQELKEKMETLEEKLDSARAAEEKLRAFSKSNKQNELKRTIRKSIDAIEEVQKSIRIELEDAQFKLLKMETADGGVFSNFSYAIFDFFKTKGKNLLLALAVFLGLYWLLGMGQDRFISLFMMRMSKAVEHPGQVHWVKRPLKVFYSLFTFIAALFMAVATLYLLNDWVLVTFIILLLVGLAWSSRNYVPQYFELFKIVLNFGAVREGERLVYNGLPWKVKTLGYYCRLVNPALSGGTLRVNSKELLQSFSRPVGDTEPWFPTRKDDWVELSDGTYGKVTMQSPEYVTIKLIGDQIKTIATSEFISLNPINLSNDFGIGIIFGVDYDHQKVVLTEVLTNFKTYLQSRLYEEFEADKEGFQALVVEFQQAGASSLDLRVFLKCAGKLASRKKFFERKLNSYLVEACNEFDYVIPFNQLTVHHAGKND